MFFTYSLILYSSYQEKYFEYHGIVMASSFKEACQKLEEDYGKDIVEMNLTQYDIDGANAIETEELLLAINAIKPLDADKYDV